MVIDPGASTADLPLLDHVDTNSYNFVLVCVNMLQERQIGSVGSGIDHHSIEHHWGGKSARK